MRKPERVKRYLEIIDKYLKIHLVEIIIKKLEGNLDKKLGTPKEERFNNSIEIVISVIIIKVR